MRNLYSSLEQRIEVLRNNPYFSTLPESALRELAAETQLRFYDKGEVIFLEGEDAVFVHDFPRGLLGSDGRGNVSRNKGGHMVIT